MTLDLHDRTRLQSTLGLADIDETPVYVCEPGESDLSCERCKNRCREHYDFSGAQICKACLDELRHEEAVREMAGDDAYEAGAEY